MIFITAKQAKELMKDIPDDAYVFLDVMDTVTLEHEPKRRIDKKEQSELIKLAKSIQYQDNDFFGVFLMRGIKKNNLHNILFPQLE